MDGRLRDARHDERLLAAIHRDIERMGLSCPPTSRITAGRQRNYTGSLPFCGLRLIAPAPRPDYPKSLKHLGDHLTFTNHADPGR